MTAREGRASSARPTQAQLAQHLVDAVEALICVVDGEGRIMLSNPALQRFTGQDAETLRGKRFWDVWVAPEDVALAEHAVQLAIESGRTPPQEGDWLTVDGERRRVTMRTTALHGDDGMPYGIACVGLDVTDDRAREARLRHQTRTDVLTGLANRGALFDALRAKLDAEDGTGCGLLFCDLDQFKAVNDEYGHATGDRLLAEAAARLAEAAGPGHLVARFGGDEFVILCPCGDEAEMRRLAERVTGQVGRPFPGPEGPLLIGVSVGIAAGQPGEPVDAVIARADQSMYGAKSSLRRRNPRA